MAALGKIFGAIGRLFGRAGTTVKPAEGGLPFSGDKSGKQGRIHPRVEAGRRKNPRLVAKVFGSSVPTGQKQFEPKIETRTVADVFGTPPVHREQPPLPPDWHFHESYRTTYASTIEQFLHGVPIEVESEHVRWIKYTVDKTSSFHGQDNGVLFICFHGGQDLEAVYQYDRIDEPLAVKIFNDGSHVGTRVWDHLRVRGTIFGYKKPYSLLSGLGNYTPKYEEKPIWREEHGSIPASGAVPEIWLEEGQGPYSIDYLAGDLNKNGGVIPAPKAKVVEPKRDRKARRKRDYPSWYGS